MEVKQIAEIMNGVTGEILGNTELVTEDLSNIVDVGNEILDKSNVDNYVKSLVNRIGKVIFVNRAYNGSAPSVMMDGWEFGSVLEKIACELPNAEENSSWDLTDGQEYKQDVFHAPKVSAKFFNKKVTFEVTMSFTELQVKESFGSAAELNGFLTMLANAVEKSMTIKMDSLIMRTINNMTAETLAKSLTFDATTGFAGQTSTRAVNLLKLYNDKFGTTLTANKALTTQEFIRFSSLQIGLYRDRMSKISTLFNIGGKERFTAGTDLHMLLLSDFSSAANVYLQSDTFHNELTALPTAETVPYWQGSGKSYDFASVSGINVKLDDKTSIATGGILGVMFDREALGVTNLDRRVTTAYNAKAEFFNNFFKFDAGYFNDLNENFVVFFVA